MKLRPILLYCLFFIIIFFLFLVFLFPQKEFAVIFSRLLTGLNPNVQVTIDNVKPELPFKLSFENTKVIVNQTMEIIPESLDVFLGPAVLFAKEKPVKFKSGIYQGALNGSLILSGMDQLQVSQARVFMSGVKISNLAYITDLAGIMLDCEVSGEYRQVEIPDENQTGHGAISIKDFSAKMKDSLFNRLNLPLVDFSDIALEFTQSSHNITVTQCNAKGSIINIKFAGHMVIILPLQESRLDFTGTILPDSPYLAKFANTGPIKSAVKNIAKNGVKFNIKGTLKNPKIEI